MRNILRGMRSLLCRFSKPEKQQLLKPKLSGQNTMQHSKEPKSAGQVIKVLNPDETIRTATTEDYDDVMAIDRDVNIKGSRVPQYFSTWITNPIYHPYVYLVNNKTVGFTCLMTIDDGSTGIFCISYLLKAYQKKAMVEKMTNAVMEIHGVSRDYAAVAYNTHNASRDFVDETRYKYVIKKKVSTFKGFKDQYRNLKEIGNTQTIQRLGQSDLQRLIQNKEQYPMVFKEKRVVVDTVPYKLIQQNVPLICCNKTTIYGSFLNEPEKTLLTFGTHFRMTSGEIYCKLTVYGTINNCFPYHILGHVHAFMNDTEDTFLMEVACENIDEQFIDVFVRLGLCFAPKDVYNRVQMIVGGFGYPLPPFKRRSTVAKL